MEAEETGLAGEVAVLIKLVENQVRSFTLKWCSSVCGMLFFFLINLFCRHKNYGKSFMNNSVM